MKNKSLKNRLIIIMTTIIFLAVTSLGVLAYYVSSNEVYKRYLSESKGVSDYTHLLIDKLFGDAEIAIGIVEKRLRDEGVIIIDSEDLTFEFLSIVQEGVENSSTLYLGLSDGSFYLYPKRYVAEDYDPRVRPWYENSLASQEKIIWIDPYIDHGTNELTVSASKYVDMPGRSEEGVVGIDILLSELSEVISDSIIGETGYVMLLKNHSLVIGHRNETLIGNNVEDIKEEFDQQFAEKYSAQEDFFETDDNIYLSRNLNKYGISIISIINKDDIRNANYRLLLNIGIITILLLILSEIIAIRFANNIVYPILRLRDVMLITKEGNYGVRCEEKTDDEVGVLINGFNEMIDSIQEKTVEMQALYEELYASEETLKEQYDELFENREFIKKSEERYRLIFEASKEGLWDANKDWEITHLTPSWYESFNMSTSNPTLKDWQNLVHPDDKVRLNELIKDHIEGKTESYRCEYRVLNVKGEYRWIESIGKAQFDDEGAFASMSGSHLDITKRRDYQDKILEMAYKDSLTGIHNRMYFKEALHKDLEENRTGSVLLLDLNDFKNINDTYGHSIGDEILKELARRLEAYTKGFYTLARFSGDEFVILLHNVVNLENIKEIIDELLIEINRAIRVESNSFKMTGSIGVSSYPKDGENTDELLQNADISMYFAKRITKKPYHIFDDEIKTRVLLDMNIENALRTALDKNELYLNYQPIIDIKSKKIRSFEALLRWESEKLGKVFPDRFIPIAEKTGLINEIGAYVLEEACKFGLEINENSIEEYVMSVNISVVQLLQDDFVDRIMGIIENSGLPYRLLDLEITESVMLEANENVLAKLFYIQNKGIKLSLDDFGTGYSSIKNLLKLPLTNLKIDKSIISDSVNNEHVYSLLESIVEYSHKMDIQVVAEGIETANYLQKVTELNVDYAQGYLFSKPIGEQEVIEMIG